jgi:hypothetical protein
MMRFIGELRPSLRPLGTSRARSVEPNDGEANMHNGNRVRSARARKPVVTGGRYEDEYPPLGSRTTVPGRCGSCSMRLPEWIPGRDRTSCG